MTESDEGTLSQPDVSGGITPAEDDEEAKAARRAAEKAAKHGDEGVTDVSDLLK